MRIAYVAADITLGTAEGGSTHVEEVRERLAQDNEVLTVAKSGSDGDDIVTAPFLDLPFLRLLNAVPGFIAVRKQVNAFGPDIIYERASSYGTGALLSRVLDVPLVVEVNDLKSSPLSFRRAARIITTSDVLVPEKYHGKTDIVTWGADTETFDPETNTCGGLEETHGLDGKTVIGYLGGFYRWHGVADIVEAAEILDRDDLVFLLVGDGRQKGRIERMIADRGLEDRLVLPGRVPHGDAPSYMACFDVALAPYNPGRHRKLAKTGMFYTPLKNFEYMAAGKPVVTTRSGNLETMFTDRDDAVLVEPGNPAGLAAAIEELVEDDALRERLGRNARELVVENYSWDSHCEKLQAIFEEVT